MKLSEETFINTTNYQDTLTGPGTKKSEDTEDDDVERPDDDKALVPEEDDDFDNTYGDLDGGNDADILPGSDKGTEIL